MFYFLPSPSAFGCHLSRRARLFVSYCQTLILPETTQRLALWESSRRSRVRGLLCDKSLSVGFAATSPKVRYFLIFQPLFDNFINLVANAIKFIVNIFIGKPQYV